MAKVILSISSLAFADTSAVAYDHSKKMSWVEFKNHFITEICSSKPKRMKAVLQELGSFTVANEDSTVIRERTQWATDLISGIQKKRFRCSKNGNTYLKRGDKFLDPVSMAEIKIGDAKYKAPFLHLPVRPTLETILATSKMINSFRGRDSLDLSQLALLEKKPDFINTDQMAYLLKSQLSDSSRERLVFVRAFKMLKSENIDEVSEALRNLSNIPSRKTLTAITKVRKNIDPVKNPELIEIADDAIAEIKFSIQIGKAMSIVYSGLSYSSILFLASIGLAIVFGLMGVINLAQGELIMIGAYVTFVIQESLAAVFPVDAASISFDKHSLCFLNNWGHGCVDRVFSYSSFVHKASDDSFGNLGCEYFSDKYDTSYLRHTKSRILCARLSCWWFVRFWRFSNYVESVSHNYLRDRYSDFHSFTG